MIENYLDGLIQQLFVSPCVINFKVLRRVIGEEEGYIRVKCHLLNRDILEFAEYVQLRGNMIYQATYSFHWQTSRGKLVKRWDNVRHHIGLETFPHHLHLADDEVVDSEPMNLTTVLADIEKSDTAP